MGDALGSEMDRTVLLLGVLAVLAGPTARRPAKWRVLAQGLFRRGWAAS